MVLPQRLQHPPPPHQPRRQIDQIQVRLLSEGPVPPGRLFEAPHLLESLGPSEATPSVGVEERHGYGDMSDYWFWLRAEYFVKHLLGDDRVEADIAELRMMGERN